MSDEPFRLVPRTEIGLPATVRSSSGRPRPLVAAPARFLTVHYTGVPRSYRDADTPEQIRHIQRIFADTKPWEYNWVIGQENDNRVFEYAGEFRAAHSAGENGFAHGVLFLNGISDPLTDLQVRKFRWLRDRVLFPNGWVGVWTEQRGHRDMPSAATACPGDLIRARWDELLKPFEASVDDEILEVGMPLMWRHKDHPEVFLLDSRGVEHLSRTDFVSLRDQGVRLYDGQSSDALYFAFKAVTS